MTQFTLGEAGALPSLQPGEGGPQFSREDPRSRASSDLEALSTDLG